jgi:hypothetical protein
MSDYQTLIANRLASLRADNSARGDCIEIAAEADAEIARLTAERDAAVAELKLRRKSGSASDRLHNLIEGLSKDADGSEWSREEWERLDADMLVQKQRIKALEVERDAAVAALHRISLCSQNSMSSKEECGRIARDTLAARQTTAQEQKP